MKLPPISQLGFVVSDLERELPRFRSLYGGDFLVQRFSNEGCWYRGAQCDCVIDAAFGMNGELELEVLQPIAGLGPHREFLESGRQGLHHLQYRVTNIDPYVDWLETEGYGCIWRMPRKGDAALAYMTRGDDPLVVELIAPVERPPRRA
jgi:hypothetical protein